MPITIYKNISELLTLEEAYKKDGRNLLPEDISIINDGAIVFDDSKILWVGLTKDIPKKYQSEHSENLKGKTVIPEIVDCHTHIPFGGNRATEYSMRLNGADYQAIAQAGGGILNTMNGTNSASADELFDIGVERIKRINSYGVGTIEIKSGYGLNFDKEYEISHIIDRLKKHFAGKIQIFNTYLAAHAIPKQYSSSAKYMDEVVIPLLDKLAPEKIIDCVDIFHEQGYFTTEDTIKLFERAGQLNIPIKSHADEFNDNDGAALAVKYNALSTDHLMASSDRGIEALAQSNTVATLLPGTSLFLGKPLADAQKFLKAGCKVALASDYNPGSCHCDNLLMLAAIAAPQYKLNISQLWAGITLNAAAAIGYKDQGAIIEGLKPRFTVFNTDSIAKITYNWGRNFSVSI